MTAYSTIAELPHFIVLDDYTLHRDTTAPAQHYQSEAELEREFIVDLVAQGYEYLPHLTSPEALLHNVREQLQELNQVHFSDSEWERFRAEYLDKPGDSSTDKSEKLHRDYIYDFVFDDGRIRNIYLIDKVDLTRNKLQVINQFEQSGTYANRYDVTILVNGLPLVQIELKKRGVAIREAFNQIHRYSKESFNSESSLYKYLQLFVISNGTDTRYFANTTKRDKHSFDFTMNWARSNNKPIQDLKDFTATFFQKSTLLQVLLTYSVFDESKTLLVMRPYQIAATERILWRIKSAQASKKWSTPESGGYIWHTTGSGKTLTSFKAAQLATQLEGIDKVFFVVDRKDLDYQTIKEYQRFSPDSVNGSNSTEGLKRNIDKDDNKIIVTTIQKLNNLMRESELSVYDKRIVFIFDECHRSQFGEAQRNLKHRFRHYIQFGFTGTPIFAENAIDTQTTQDVFGRQLHAYVITDAIRDEKVLKFKVDYNNVHPKFRVVETEQDEQKLNTQGSRDLLLYPERIKEIAQYILQNFKLKTHRTSVNDSGFNAMFAVSSVEAAKLYYQELKHLQTGSEHPLRIATIYSFAPNEEQSAKGETPEEGFETSALDTSAKESLASAIDDYNVMFGTSFGLDSQSFQNYYRDLSLRVKRKEVDLLIVVGMFLTGFDAPTLNTLFVDKNLSYHGLIQAYSRTNRIYDATKSFGNIVTFRDLEQATIDAITLFGEQNAREVILAHSYTDYLYGYTSAGQEHRGYIEIVQELQSKFPHPTDIEREIDKKDFARLFGEYLKAINILQNYDEFTRLKALQSIDKSQPEEVEQFRQTHFLTEEQIEQMLRTPVIPERSEQDYRSVYNDIREHKKATSTSNTPATNSPVDWSDIVFEVELLKSQEINLDYILELLFEHHQKNQNKLELIEEVRRIIRSSIGNRAKESLIIDFINSTDLDILTDKPSLIEAFYIYAQERQRIEAGELIAQEGLREDKAKHYIELSLRREYASENGSDLNDILPKMSPLNPKYLSKKQEVFAKISAFVEKFKGIGIRI